MIFYQGWSDGDTYPGAVMDYFREMVKTTFGGDDAAASGQTRLFMAPGVGHCSGVPRPNEWAENGKAPDHEVAIHRGDSLTPPADAKVDNERKPCPYRRQAVYTGPAGGQNDRRNWVASNVACKTK